jgi:hypothetical protein
LLGLGTRRDDIVGEGLPPLHTALLKLSELDEDDNGGSRDEHRALILVQIEWEGHVRSDNLKQTRLSPSSCLSAKADKPKEES